MATIKIVPTNSEEIKNQIKVWCKMNGTTLKALGDKIYGAGKYQKLQNRITNGNWTKNAVDDVNKVTGLSLSIKWGEISN